MKELDKIKVTFIAVFTAVHSFLGTLAVPIYILVTVMIIDYITGLMAAPFRGEVINSKKGIQGIIKKICTGLLIAVGVVLDYCILFVEQTMGMDAKFMCIISIAVTFWIMANELISILENISDTGVELPPFLLAMAKYVKDYTEDIADDTAIEKLRQNTSDVVHHKIE